jgi:hypothetical protein
LRFNPTAGNYLNPAEATTAHHEFYLFEARLYLIAAGEKSLIVRALFFKKGFFRMSPIQRRELENIVNVQIAGIIVLSRHLKWIKSSEGSGRNSQQCRCPYKDHNAIASLADVLH